MPVSIGGLGFSPSKIGYIMGAYGLFTGIFQLFAFTRVLEWIGEKKTYIYGLGCTMFLFGLLPFMNWMARRGLEEGSETHTSVWIWASIAVIIMAWTGTDMAFGTHPLPTALNNFTHNPCPNP